LSRAALPQEEADVEYCPFFQGWRSRDQAASGGVQEERGEGGGELHLGELLMVWRLVEREEEGWVG